LVFHRWTRGDSPAATTLPGLMGDLIALGVDADLLRQRMAAVGWDPRHDDTYRQRPVRLTEERAWPVTADFPSIVRGSFANGELPSGVVRIAYTIDVTNDPVEPLDAVQLPNLWREIAES